MNAQLCPAQQVWPRSQLACPPLSLTSPPTVFSGLQAFTRLPDLSRLTARTLRAPLYRVREAKLELRSPTPLPDPPPPAPSVVLLRTLREAFAKRTCVKSSTLHGERTCMKTAILRGEGNPSRLFAAMPFDADSPWPAQNGVVPETKVRRCCSLLVYWGRWGLGDGEEMSLL